MHKLDPKLRERLAHISPSTEKKGWKKYQNPHQAATALNTLLVQEDPDKFNLHWVLKRDQPLGRFMQKNSQDLPDGSKDYSLVISLLPQSLQKKWQYDFQEKKRSDYKNILEDLTKILRQKNPQTFNQEWLENNAPKIYARIYRHFRDKETGKIKWDLFINGFPKDLQSKWRLGYRDEVRKELSIKNKKYTYQTAIEALSNFIKNQKGIVTSNYLYLHKRDLYNHFSSYVRKGDDIDWNKIEADLPAQLRRRFQKPAGFNNSEEEINASFSLDEILDKYGKYLYTFLHASTPVEKAMLEELCRSFIILIRKGDLPAKEKFIFNLDFVINDWIEKSQRIAIYKNYPDDLNTAIERCIKNYRMAENTRFLDYLYATLSQSATSLFQKTKIVELDQNVRFQDAKISRDRRGDRINLNSSA